MICGSVKGDLIKTVYFEQYENESPQNHTIGNDVNVVSYACFFTEGDRGRVEIRERPGQHQLYKKPLALPGIF